VSDPVDRGWIPAHRKLYDPDHILAPSKRDPSCRRDAWLDLCQMAQHSPRTHHGERLERGQALVAVRTKAQHWGWSKSRVSRFLLWLASEAMIGTVRGTPYGTVYRIVNYDTYAVAQNGERDTQRDTERDASGTAAGQEQQWEQQNKKSMRRKTVAYSEQFETIWSIHPRGPKAPAQEQYKKAMANGVTHQELLTYLRRYVESEINDRFRGHDLFRWIRDERWEEYRTKTNGAASFVADEAERWRKLAGSEA